MVLLRWNETESMDCKDGFGGWKPRAPQAGDILIINEDGLKLAVLPDTAWKWRQREDCRKLD